MAKQNKSRGRRPRFSLMSLFSGSVLSSKRFMYYLPSLGYGCLLMIIYIAIGYTVQHRQRELNEVNKEITKLKTISITASAVRQEMSRQRNVERLLEKFGIKMRVNPVPPRIIRITDKK